MAEAIMDTEIERKIAKAVKQLMVELQPLLSSHPSYSSSNYLQQQQQVEDVATIDIKKMIKDCGDGLLLPECCIYRVPITLRHHKEDAYTPKVVSIGPFHYGKERLQDMERHKQTLFKRFIERTTSSLDDLVRFVKHLLPKIRASYSETIEPNEQKLVELILMDAGFIIELFISSWKDELRIDAKLSQPWLWESINQDLLLLENQLPFFVIEELFNKAVLNDRRWRLPSFLRLTYDHFWYFNKQELEPNPDVKINHFTDLLRLFYLPKKKPPRDTSSTLGSHFISFKAHALQEAGIKLKASTSKCLLDLKFSRHVLEIPQILVEDRTEIFFRNMIALEQCHYPDTSYITDYALVLDCLIDTDKDVNLLVHKKIVRNCLGDTNSVALVFNGILKNVIQSEFNSEYVDMFQRLNRHCEDPWHKKMATLRRDYCNTPWRTVASIAGIILLLLTIEQAIVSILQVVLKK